METRLEQSLDENEQAWPNGKILDTNRRNSNLSLIFRRITHGSFVLNPTECSDALIVQSIKSIIYKKNYYKENNVYLQLSLLHTCYVFNHLYLSSYSIGNTGEYIN